MLCTLKGQISERICFILLKIYSPNSYINNKNKTVSALKQGGENAAHMLPCLSPLQWLALLIDKDNNLLQSLLRILLSTAPQAASWAEMAWALELICHPHLNAT